jgi:hypothetical protein
MFRAPTISIKDLIQQGSESWNKAFQYFHGCQPGACSLLQQGKGLKKMNEMTHYSSKVDNKSTKPV